MSRIPDSQEDSNYMVKISDEDVISALGLLWQPFSDSFRFIMKDWTPPNHMTKRSLLSDINSVYDPIGLVSPVLIKGKIFLQQLWSLKLGWDDQLNKDLQLRWIKFYSSLRLLSNLHIPRCIVSSPYNRIELHGYCDASQEAFGACLYVRSISCNNYINAHLYTSKSRVAPIRASSIPRLELCGALLLAELVSEVQTELQLLNIILPPNQVFLWTDSTIVLGWIKSECLFQVYVSNRIARIQDITSREQWHYVPTADNPADFITRGIDAAAISSSNMWWHGPQWLNFPQSFWPINPELPNELPEIRPVKLILATLEKESFWILNNYSSWSKLLRITVLLRRFIVNCQNCPSKRRTGFITVQEIKEAQIFWIDRAQFQEFSQELCSLKSHQSVHRRRCLTKLSPYLDEYGLIRVGGRLEYAPIPYFSKHPIVLPYKSTITKLIFEYEHRRLMHIGPQGLLAHISNKFWVIRGRIIARKTVHNCVQCFRAKPNFIPPHMAPLPSVRVTVERAFVRTGLDYCGPIMIRSGIRKKSPTKGYICVFVCMVTKAVHLELVSSLSKEDFLATLYRFMARRGQCSHLYSDNGTNFVGANRQLKSHFEEFRRNQEIAGVLAMQEIQWHFITPAAPHFGGLWEAAVQSAKRHLLRISKGVMLTYDETTTLLCKIKAALNSRPLTPSSLDPTDFNVLTPGHFLVGSTLMLPPEPDLSNIPINRLRQFKLMQAQMQLWWKRWSAEYLPQIQRRGKWTKVNRNIAVGDLAILKDANVPPIHWHMVRVKSVHPGLDGVVRAVTVRNSSGQEFKRPVIKLAMLPNIEDETSHENLAE